MSRTPNFMHTRSNVRKQPAGCAAVRSLAISLANSRTRIPGDKDLYRISPANPGRMRDPDAVGQMRHWIIEVHLIDRARTFGGFYERLLQPADMDRDKTWLSVSGLDVPMPLSNGGDDAAV